MELLAQRAKTGAHRLTSHDVLQLQRTIGNKAVQRLIGSHGMGQSLQRKLDGSLQGADPKIRLEFLLSGIPAQVGLAAPGKNLYEQIVNSPAKYDWATIQTNFGHLFPQKLNTLTAQGTQRFTLYRADGRSPGKLKGSNPPGFGTRTVTPFELLKAALIKDPKLFIEDHVRQNRQDLKSYATDLGAGGYASADRYLYEIDFGQWSRFQAPKMPGSAAPIILANNATLTAATQIAVDTNKPTKEVFLLFEVGLNDITSVRDPGANAFAPINWSNVVAEAK
jgi:hypothetical protein